MKRCFHCDGTGLVTARVGGKVACNECGGTGESKRDWPLSHPVWPPEDEALAAPRGDAE